MTAPDMEKLDLFMQKVVADMGAAVSGVLTLIGDQLGLYKAMAGAGPLTPAELARRTDTNERYVAEWLNNQAAGGYVSYDPEKRAYSLGPEQALALADETSPFFIQGAYQVLSAMWKAEPRIANNFRTGEGLSWREHDPALFEGTERFFRPNYAGHLVSSWIPSLDGVEEKLRRGARVADVGCGWGASTVLMAEAYPASTFAGFDFHEPSIWAARKRAQERGLEQRVRFETASSTDYPGREYDFVAHFDALHDMGDPVGAARHVRDTLAPDGTWMLVEPYAGDRPEENFNPVGRVFYGASTMICVPASLAFHGPALGAQAGEARLRDLVVSSAGFRHFRRAAETPFNLVLEARP